MPKELGRGRWVQRELKRAKYTYDGCFITGQWQLKVKVKVSLYRPNFYWIFSPHQDHSTARRIKSMKNPSTSVGIEPDTFRLIAQCLNQLGRPMLLVGNHVVLSSVGLHGILGVMFIISPSSKEWYGTTSSFQILVNTIITRLSELYIFSS